MSALARSRVAWAAGLVVGVVLSGASAVANSPTPDDPAIAVTSGDRPRDEAEIAATSRGGLGPMRNGAPVPRSLLPPGATVPDRGPSPVIFPPQSMTLRFNHTLHVKEQHVACTTCHPGGASSESAADRLVPAGAACDGCHGTDHGAPNGVRPGPDALGQCAYCHVGYVAEDGNRVARFRIPAPNMIFNHKKHAARNIGCGQCHGAVESLELATRDQLPRMRGCLTCHQHPDSASRGDAKAACDTCHLRAGAVEGGLLRTSFASGRLEPPRWLRNAEHTPDFVQRHKFVAANDSQFCANCHKEESCTACHDGRVRPRNIHPSDYLNMHAIEARLLTSRCTSCHREQSFCLTCHQRLGITMSGPAAVREPGRFHPPKAEWSDTRGGPSHHAVEAMRNLNACVSCHIERDCVVCHGGQGIGAGFSPHPPGFASTCSGPMRRNPRPCLVCHDPSASVLERCR